VEKIIHDMLSAVQHLHNKSILHNDIKGNNILIEKTLRGELRGVLIDLGKGCLIKDAKQHNIIDDSKKWDHIKGILISHQTSLMDIADRALVVMYFQ